MRPSPREPSAEAISAFLDAHRRVMDTDYESSDLPQVAIGAGLRAAYAAEFGVRGESLPLLPAQASPMDLQPLIARIRKDFGGDSVTASASELARFIEQIIDLTLAEVDRTDTAPRHPGNIVGGGGEEPD